VPIFRDFMKEALKDKPPVPFRIPPGIHMVRVNAATGRPTDSSDKNAIYEAFSPTPCRWAVRSRCWTMMPA